MIDSWDRLDYQDRNLCSWAFIPAIISAVGSIAGAAISKSGAKEKTAAPAVPTTSAASVQDASVEARRRAAMQRGRMATDVVGQAGNKLGAVGG